LEAKSPAAIRYTKECIRSVRRMDYHQALDYLNCKNDALRFRDPEQGREKGLKKFLDDKSYKPGLGEYQRA
jgi:trans-feruloyl-CoA hydratase/vanillin synthase